MTAARAKTHEQDDKYTGMTTTVKNKLNTETSPEERNQIEEEEIQLYSRR